MFDYVCLLLHMMPLFLTGNLPDWNKMWSCSLGEQTLSVTREVNGQLVMLRVTESGNCEAERFGDGSGNSRQFTSLNRVIRLISPEFKGDALRRAKVNWGSWDFLDRQLEQKEHGVTTPKPTHNVPHFYLRPRYNHFCFKMRDTKTVTIRDTEIFRRHVRDLGTAQP
jgi:hypothetical protein